jgi:putative ABC transport system ATP-binding protein
MTGVQVSSVMHIYRTDEVEVIALRGVDLQVEPGEMVALLGPSGSGKSTLLTVLAGLIRPSAGTVRVAGEDIARLSERDLLAFRRNRIGIMLQGTSRNLLPYASVQENLHFAQRGSGRSTRQARSRSAELLALVGLEDLSKRRAVSLSGGEQQRLSLAVSVVNEPAVLLADEPTSQLDQHNADRVAALLREVRDRHGTTVVTVTHDENLATTFDRTVSMRDGRVGTESRHGEAYAVIGRDGSLQLPAELGPDFPPGTLVRVLRTEHGVELRPRRPAARDSHD